MSRSSSYLGILLLSCVGVSCDSSPPGYNDPGELRGRASCSLPLDQVRASVARDAIPALSDPPLSTAAEAEYLSDEDRVLGFVIGARAVAVPLSILRYHEILNFDQFDTPVAVTYCPLTGSGIGFDRSEAENAEFGVSGMLFRNNLIMFDRRTEESLWPQMDRSARCGPADGVLLSTFPVLEITWEGWVALHPETKVVSTDTGFERNYRVNPYGDYGTIGNNTLLYDMFVDPRRPMKERVLGVPSGDGGIAIPFTMLNSGAPVRAVPLDARGNVVIFWHRAFDTAMAYGVPENLQDDGFIVRDGRIIDVATESVWGVDGRAIEGPLRGTRLEPVRDAYVAYWFAWAAFQPKTTLWEGDRG